MSVPDAIVALEAVLLKRGFALEKTHNWKGNASAPMHAAFVAAGVTVGVEHDRITWLVSLAFSDPDGSSVWHDVETWANWNATPLRDRRSIEEMTEFIERYLEPIGGRVRSRGVQRVAAEMDARERSAFGHVRALAAALPSALKVARERPPKADASEAWAAYALYRSADTIDRSLSDAPGALRTHPLDALVDWGEIVNHAFPTPDEVAAAIAALERRGWLVEDDFHFGLSREALSLIGGVVGRGTPAEEIQRLRRWMREHGAAGARP